MRAQVRLDNNLLSILGDSRDEEAARGRLLT